MKKIKNLSVQIKSLAVIVLVVGVGIVLTHATFAATASLTFVPSSSSVNKDDTFTVTVHSNTGSDAAIGAAADISYTTSTLQFVSSTTPAPWLYPGGDSGGSGSISLVRYSTAPGISGDNVVSVLTFKAIAVGTATLTFKGTSEIRSAADNSNILSSSPSVNISVVTAPVTPPPTTPPSTGGGGSTGSGSAPSAGGSTTPNKSTSVNVSTSGSSGVDVANNGSVAVNSNSVTVQPTTVQTEGVAKVEYYLGDKLVDTSTKAPYSYNVATGKLKNGTYDLVTKTYYQNGTVKQSTQHLVIKNASKKTAVAPISITVLALVLLVGVFLVLQRRRTPVSAFASQSPSQSIVTSDAPKVAPVEQPNPALQAAIPKPNNNMPSPGTVITVQDDKTQQ